MISLVPTEEMPSVRNSRDAFDTIRALDSAVSDLDFLMKQPHENIVASFRDRSTSKYARQQLNGANERDHLWRTTNHLKKSETAGSSL
jgi:hypothetical protein